MSVDGRNYELGRVLQAQQRFVRVQAEIVLKSRIHAGQHADVCARAEEVSCAGEYDHMHAVVHAGRKNSLVQLPVHLIAVSIGRRITQFNDSDSGIISIVDESSLPLSGGQWLPYCHAFLLRRSALLDLARRDWLEFRNVVGGPLLEIPFRNMSPMWRASSSAFPSTRGLYQV